MHVPLNQAQPHHLGAGLVRMAGPQSIDHFRCDLSVYIGKEALVLVAGLFGPKHDLSSGSTASWTCDGLFFFSGTRSDGTSFRGDLAIRKVPHTDSDCTQFPRLPPT